MPIYKHTEYERLEAEWKRDQQFMWTARLAVLIFACLIVLWLWMGLQF